MHRRGVRLRGETEVVACADRLVAKPGVPSERPLKQADMQGGDAARVRGPWEAPIIRGETAESPALPPG